MIKRSIVIALALSSGLVNAACPVNSTATLCFDPADSDLSPLLTQKEKVARVNGDSLLDKIYVDANTKEINVRQGSDCGAGSANLCFDAPIQTGILNNKSFAVGDLIGNGIAELAECTDQDVIKAYNQPGYGQGLDEGNRIGDSAVISLFGTNGLTEDRLYRVLLSEVIRIRKIPNSVEFDMCGTVRNLQNYSVLAVAANGHLQKFLSTNSPHSV